MCEQNKKDWKTNNVDSRQFHIDWHMSAGIVE